MYRVFNKYTLVIEESIYVVFDETNDPFSRKEDVIDNDAGLIDNNMEKLTLKESITQNNKKKKGG